MGFWGFGVLAETLFDDELRNPLQLRRTEAVLRQLPPPLDLVACFEVELSRALVALVELLLATSL